jgi:hypothetical protein
MTLPVGGTDELLPPVTVAEKEVAPPVSKLREDGLAEMVTFGGGCRAAGGAVATTSLFVAVAGKEFASPA